MRTACAVLGSVAPQIYKSRGGVNPLPCHLASTALFPAFPSQLHASLASPLLVSSSDRRLPCFQLSPAMAPPQPIVVLDPMPWTRSSVTPFALNELVNGGLLASNVEGAPPAWIVPPASDREPNPPYGYIVSFVRLHEHGFTAPASRFMRGLCYHYRIELHNFAPNVILQVATFVTICEGFLGIPVNWDLWIHMFHAELQPLLRARRRCIGWCAPAA
jgi:hypothetical protein